MHKEKKLDKIYAPALEAHHVTLAKLTKLKTALRIAYIGLPISLIGFLMMLILDDNHPIAESIPLALVLITGFFIAVGAFIYVAINPIYRRLMNRVLQLDEGEIHLQHQAYSFAYGILFKGIAFAVFPIVGLMQIVNLDRVSASFPKVEGAYIVTASALVLIFIMLMAVMLPMIYLAWNLKPVGEND